MQNKNSLLLPLDYGLFDITTNHSYSVLFWLEQLFVPRVETLTVTDLLIYCICHYAEILKSFQIDYWQEKKSA